MSEDKVRIIDTHSHFNFEFFDNCRDEAMKRYREAGGDKLLVVGCTMDSNKSAIKVASEYENCFATVGIHPTSVDELTDESLAWIKKQIEEGRAVAVGETGLDYYHMTFPKELQHEGLRRQARLAKELDVPVIIHSRDKGMVSSKIEMDNKSDPGKPGPSAVESLEILKEEGVERAIFHCFSYGVEFAREVWEAGYITSFACIVTYPKNGYLREAAAAAPEDKILIETDCPYLAPQKYRGQDNEPAFVLEAAKCIAKLRDMSLEEFSELTARNAEIIFGI